MFLIKLNSSNCLTLIFSLENALWTAEIPNFDNSIIIATYEESVIGKMNSIDGTRVCFFDQMNYFSRSIDKSKSLVFSASSQYLIDYEVQLPEGLKRQYLALSRWASVMFTIGTTSSGEYLRLYRGEGTFGCDRWWGKQRWCLELDGSECSRCGDRSGQSTEGVQLLVITPFVVIK